MSNVALGFPAAVVCRGPHHSSSMLRLASGVLLLASGALGHVLRRNLPSVSDVAPDHDDIKGHASHAHHTAGNAGSEVVDSGRLITHESEKVKEKLRKSIKKNVIPPSLAWDGETNYLIASFPELRVINYVRMPDLVWRPLVVTGVLSPKSIAIDEERSRLYVADTAVAKIFWYQLIALPDKTLISDGRQHVAVASIVARNIALDLTGELWFSGVSTPVPPVVAIDGIFKQPLVVIDQSSTSGVPVDPIPVWSNSYTKSMPSPLVLDSFNIYYGNDNGGEKAGSVVKAPQNVPIADPPSALKPAANNADNVYSVAVTPTAIFYGTDEKIYGVLKSKVGGTCGSSGDLCKVITDLVKKPTQMFWDGDGSIMLADNSAGAIYAFASGSVSPHALDKIVDAKEIWGLGLLKVVADESSAPARAAPLALAAVLVSALFLW